MEPAPLGVTETGTCSQPPPGLGQGLTTMRAPASPGLPGTSYHGPRAPSKAAHTDTPSLVTGPHTEEGGLRKGKVSRAKPPLGVTRHQH